MPSGYTADIATKNITFEQFTMRCARQFGALILMRDEPMDAPIPDEFQPGDYHTKQLADIQVRLDALKAMSPAELEQQADANFQKQLEEYNTCKTYRSELATKYTTLLAQVMLWKPPTPEHFDLKEFMVKQLQDSLDMDCDMTYVSVPVRLTGEQWHNQQFAQLTKNCIYHTEENKKEVERTNNRNTWIKALRDSLLQDQLDSKE